MSRYYPEVASRAGHRCEYCHAPEAIFNIPFQVDHIRPVARRGQTVISNLALACRTCNLAKAAHVTALNRDNQVQIRLFDPRNDAWSEHFAASSAGEMAGLTDIGQATVSILRMNDSTQRIARELWMRLGLFP